MASQIPAAKGGIEMLEETVKDLLATDCAPEALQLLQAPGPWSGSPRHSLMLCRVYARVGRFEMCRDLAAHILASDPLNAEASAFIALVASATKAPALKLDAPTQREYSSAIPSGFLQRLQDSVHHYKYRDVQFVKSPFDVSLYQLLLWDLKPATIIEIGSKEGGSALWLADLSRTYGLGAKIFSVDLFPVTRLSDPLITFLKGDGRDLGSTFSDMMLEALPRPWLVIEDADHTMKTSLAVLRFFHPWLRKGDYVVVEDGIMSDLYPANFPDNSSGPHLALKEFLRAESQYYSLDTYYCDFYGHNVTWNTNGFLKRIA